MLIFFNLLYQIKSELTGCIINIMESNLNYVKVWLYVISISATNLVEDISREFTNYW